MPKLEEHILDLYAEAKAARACRESGWRKLAGYCLPRHQDLWASNRIIPAKKRETPNTYDPTAVVSAQKAAIQFKQMITPQRLKWHRISAERGELRKSKQVTDFLGIVNDHLYDRRYLVDSGFEEAVNELYLSFVVYGTGAMFVGRKEQTWPGESAGLLYAPCLLRDIYLLGDEAGNITDVFHRTMMSDREFVAKFPDKASLLQQSPASNLFGNRKRTEVVHYCYRKQQKDISADRLSGERFSIGSVYFLPQGEALGGVNSVSVLSESGFLTMPYIIPRSNVQPGDVYGYGLSGMVEGLMGAINLVAETTLKVAQRTANQVLLAPDPSWLNDKVDLRSGAVNYGGVNSRGERMIHPLPPGDYMVPSDVWQMMRGQLEEGFGVRAMGDTKRRTATEYLEEAASNSAGQSIIMPSLQRGLVDPLLRREIALYKDVGLWEDAPPELEDDALVIHSTSPASVGQSPEELTGFIRAFELAGALASATGDASPYDLFDFDKVLLSISNKLSVPPSWLRGADEIKEMRDGRRKAQEMSQVVGSAQQLGQLQDMATKMGAESGG